MYEWKKIEKEAGAVLKGDRIKTYDLKSLQDDKTVLRNPHKGLYHHYYDNSLQYYLCESDEELTKVKGLNFLYVRVDWADLEPQEGVYHWALIDDLVERFYKPHGFGFSFCVVCKETNRNKIFATPEWVRKAGAKGIFQPPVCHSDNKDDIENLYENVNWTPDYSDPIYLEKLENFHRAFAERYQDEPFVEEIVMGGMGDWGEGHAWFSGCKIESIETMKKHVDMYARCYPKNQKFFNDDFIRFNLEDTGREMEMVNYCIEKGFGIRDDSINVTTEVLNHSDTYTVVKPHFFKAVTPFYPSNMETEHYRMQKNAGNWVGENGCEAGGDIIRGAFEIMCPTYFSFHGYARDWYGDNETLVDELSNKCGYWYFLNSVSLPGYAAAGDTLRIGFSWVNQGVARAYHPYQLFIKLEGDGQCYVAEAQGSDNRSWLPCQMTNETVSVPVPADAAQGNYKLKVKLVYINRSGDPTDIKLGMEKEMMDLDGFYDVPVTITLLQGAETK